MQLQTFNVSTSGRLRRENLQGRRYLVTDATLIVEGVLDGSNGPLFYPRAEFGRSPEDWNGMPVVKNHPVRTNSNGEDEHLSARTPSVLAEQGMGWLFNTHANGKLNAEVWFDEDRLKQIDRDTYNRLLTGKPIELSTGLYTENVPAPEGANFNGRPYTHVARNYKPDHLAILPDSVGACSNADGCGINVNEAKFTKPEDVDAFIDREMLKLQAVDKKYLGKPYKGKFQDELRAVHGAILAKMRELGSGLGSKAGQKAMSDGVNRLGSFLRAHNEAKGKPMSNEFFKRFWKWVTNQEEVENASPAIERSLKMMAGQHIQTAMQAEGRASNDWFNIPEAQKEFKSPRDFAKAVRAEWEKRSALNQDEMPTGNYSWQTIDSYKGWKLAKDVSGSGPTQGEIWILDDKGNPVQESTKQAWRIIVDAMRGNQRANACEDEIDNILNYDVEDEAGIRKKFGGSADAILRAAKAGVKSQTAKDAKGDRYVIEHPNEYEYIVTPWGERRNAANAEQCPECGGAMDGGVCQSCGYTVEQNASLKPGQTALLNLPGHPLMGKMFTIKTVGDPITATGVDDGKTYTFPAQTGGRDNLLVMEETVEKSVNADQVFAIGQVVKYMGKQAKIVDFVGPNMDLKIEFIEGPNKWMSKVVGDDEVKTNQRKPMKLSANHRAEVINFLVKTCDKCRAKQTKLPSLNDAQLVQLVQRVVNKTVKNADEDPAALFKWLMSAPPGIQAAMAEAIKGQMGQSAPAPVASEDPLDEKQMNLDPEGDDTLMSGNGDDTMEGATGNRRRQTFNQWYGSAPLEVREAFDVARQISGNERQRILNQLTANLSGDKKADKLKFLGNKSIAELRQLSELLPPAPQSIYNDDFYQRDAIYNAGGPAPRQREYAANEDAEMVPAHLRAG